MANVAILAPFIFSWEGGFSNHPLDQGGPTNKGVTFNTFAVYCKRKGYPSPTLERLKALTDEQAMDILKTLYWDRFRADDIDSQAIANILVDWLWGSGGTAIKHVQRIVGVADDGIMGPKTLRAINASCAHELFDKIWQTRKEFLYNIVERKPSQQVFIKGWMRRLESITFEKLHNNE